MSRIGDTIQVGKGVVSDTDEGIGFGGRTAMSATVHEPGRVRIAAWSKYEEFSVYLHEGETVQIGRQTWRLDKIHIEGGRDWYADLTRIA